MMSSLIRAPKSNIFFVVSLLLMLNACKDQGTEHPQPGTQYYGETMGTFYMITLVDSSGNTAKQEQLRGAIDSVLALINKQMSTWDPESDISRFNSFQDTTAFEVAAELVTVVAAAMRVSRESDSAFDITVGPLVNLWGFGPPQRPDELPSESEIEALLTNVGSQYINVIDDTHLRKTKPLLQIDLSAIAKGYGVDKVAELITGFGYEHFLVDIGGEIVARGNNKNGAAWSVGIDSPKPGKLPGQEFQEVLELTNVAVATSGDYRNFTEIDGNIYSHEIDPRTGWPVKHGLAGVTVIAPSCMMADAYATAIMVTGPEKGLELINHLADTEAILFLKDEAGNLVRKQSVGCDTYLMKSE
jgi:FAD:protein FMN transferase